MPTEKRRLKRSFCAAARTFSGACVRRATSASSGMVDRSRSYDRVAAVGERHDLALLLVDRDDALVVAGRGRPETAAPPSRARAFRRAPGSRTWRSGPSPWISEGGSSRWPCASPRPRPARRSSSSPSSRGGVAQTLKLYGFMKCLATPAPNFASTHSSKFVKAWSFEIVCDSTSPIRHSSIACSGSEERWFWNG